MLFQFNYFSFLPPPLSPSPKPFFFLPSELFLSDHTYIPSFSLPFLSSILLYFFILYFLTLILLWALVNLDWFTCHSFFVLFLPLLSSLSAQPFLSSTVDILQQVVIPFFSALSNYAFVTKMSTGTGLHARMNTHPRLEDKQTHCKELECAVLSLANPQVRKSP